MQQLKSVLSHRQNTPSQSQLDTNFDLIDWHRKRSGINACHGKQTATTLGRTFVKKNYQKVLTAQESRWSQNLKIQPRIFPSALITREMKQKYSQLKCHPLARDENNLLICESEISVCVSPCVGTAVLNGALFVTFAKMVLSHKNDKCRQYISSFVCSMSQWTKSNITIFIASLQRTSRLNRFCFGNLTCTKLATRRNKSHEQWDAITIQGNDSVPKRLSWEGILWTDRRCSNHRNETWRHMTQSGFRSHSSDPDASGLSLADSHYDTDVLLQPASQNILIKPHEQMHSQKVVHKLMGCCGCFSDLVRHVADEKYKPVCTSVSVSRGVHKKSQHVGISFVNNTFFIRACHRLSCV